MMREREINEWLKDIEERLNRLSYREEPVMLRYVYENAESVKRFSDWDRQRLGVLSGLEMIYVIEQSGHCLYAVNVTADSVMTAIWELMGLLSKKFSSM